MRKLFPLLFCLLLSPSWSQPLHPLVQNNDLTRVSERLEAEKAEAKEGAVRLVDQRVNQATPLHIACFVGNQRMVDLLLSYGADLEAVDLLGDSPLFRAFSEGHSELGVHLVERGAELDRTNKSGETPFMMAARSATGEVLKTFLISVFSFWVNFSQDDPVPHQIREKKTGLSPAKNPRNSTK